MSQFQQMSKRAFPHEKILSLQDNPLFCDLDFTMFSLCGHC